MSNEAEAKKVWVVVYVEGHGLTKDRRRKHLAKLMEAVMNEMEAEGRHPYFTYIDDGGVLIAGRLADKAPAASMMLGTSIIMHNPDVGPMGPHLAEEPVHVCEVTHKILSILFAGSTRLPPNASDKRKLKLVQHVIGLIPYDHVTCADLAEALSDFSKILDEHLKHCSDECDFKFYLTALEEQLKEKLRLSTS